MIKFTKYVVYSQLLAWECSDYEFKTLKDAKKEFEKQRKDPEVRRIILTAKDELDKEYIIEKTDKGIWVVAVTFTDNTMHYYRTPYYDKAADYFHHCQSDNTIKTLKLYTETFDEKTRCELWVRGYND